MWFIRAAAQEENREAEDSLENCSTQPEQFTYNRVKVGSRGQCCIILNGKKSFRGTAEQHLSLVYANLSKLAQVSLVLPIGTTDCEQGFSTMKRIKTRLRSQNVQYNFE